MPRARSLRSMAISPTRRPTSPQITGPGTGMHRPPSPTFSDATNASQLNLGLHGPEKVITRADLKASMHAYETLMDASSNYRTALMNMSKVTAAFADAMEACSGLKGPSYEAGTRLQAASGLHHLIGNHWHVLAETIDKGFEKPLRQHLETYRTIVNDRSSTYEKALHERSQIIRQTEMGNMNRRQRNLQSFREALTVLQRQVDELDEMKAQHYQEIMEHEEEVWDVVQAKICLTVRSTMDVFDRFTAKASDPVIEPMLQSIPDPFDSYGPPQAEDQIFSILQPLSISANVPSPSESPLMNTPPESETSEHDNSTIGRNSQWLPKNGEVFAAESTSQWAEVPSPTTTPPPGSSTPPRSSSPPASNINRRQSHPSSIGHQPRKSSGSKLRNALSSAVFDGSLSRRADNSPDAIRSEPSNTSSSAEPQVQDTSWGNFNYGESPYNIYTGSGGDTTPRHSSLFLPPQQYESDPQRSRTPQSDDTAHVPLAS